MVLSILQEKMSHFSSMKSLQIILALLSERSFLGIAELAKITGLSKSTIHRILSELLECDFIIKDEETKKFNLSYQIKVLLSNVKASDYLLDAAKTEMIHLNDISGETISLVALNGMEGVYIGKLDSKDSVVSVKFQVGWTLPLYCTSSGKNLLCHQDEEYLDNYFNMVPLDKLTENTITSRESLEKELNLVKKQGFAIDLMEHNKETICIAAPLFTYNQKCIGTIGIVAPSYRFSKERALEYKDEIVASANRISERLQI